TSALDSISEKKIQDAIDPLIASRTSILIAHRLSTILAADEILTVRDGEIVERGRHKDLVRAGGVYAELYETQFKGAVMEEEQEPEGPIGADSGGSYGGPQCAGRRKEPEEVPLPDFEEHDLFREFPGDPFW
ncbi:MAG: hypothetical protein Q4F25_03060, partial [Eubacteriales bacterium]|nr:hypothetical protein [Eubacteriales bacterium]